MQSGNFLTETIMKHAITRTKMDAAIIFNKKQKKNKQTKKHCLQNKNSSKMRKIALSLIRQTPMTMMTYAILLSVKFTVETVTRWL